MPIGWACKRKHLWRPLLAGLAGFWLLTAFAPCVMAAMSCSETPATCAHAADVTHDDSLHGEDNCSFAARLDCQAADENPIKPPASSLLGVPVRVVGYTPATPDYRYREYVPALLPPPLHLQNRVLLI